MRREFQKSEIEETLDKVCNDNLFTNSSTLQKLLRYLVEKKLLNEDLKELTIGLDLFDSNYSVDKHDGIVRTYIYKLRQKLVKYYAQPEVNDPIIFEIKKGQYNLSFQSPNELIKSESDKSIKIPLQKLWIGLGIALIIGTVILAKFNLEPETYLWKPFLSPDASNLVVISDQYVVSETNQYDEEHAVLYPEINNDDQFLKYQNENPERKLRRTDYSVMSKMAPFSIKSITEWLIPNGGSFDMKLESQLVFDDIRKHNIVFVGQFKTMNLSKAIFLKDSKVFSTYIDGFKYSIGDETKVYNTKHGTQRVEYAMVSYTSISPNNKVFYFVSNNDIGVMATVRNFTSPDWLKDFASKIPQEAKHFNALFQVSGIQRTDMSCELVELEVIE
ncbi:hypothetical protein [Reichenbachiella versicolor]|uniref:hypothetical protein n=1 Tax=Reichenbachiella versicolor TaxID=1821036 RepID=UPI000D6E91F3|nr:hypothetical protein [Reichenbachiella versicolor]